MSISDVRIFECVSDVLSENLGQTEAQSYLNQIRQRYYAKHLPQLPYRVLDSAISNCRTCKDAESKPLSGWWNWQDCDLLIVSANPHADERFANTLGELLKGANFSSAFCGAIHVTKCLFQKPSDENISNCSHYVYDQLDVSKPKAIAILGAQAFDLFKTNQDNYTSSIGQSWWWGVYKVFSLPSSRDFEDSRWPQILSEAYDFIYGELDEILDVK